MTTNMAVTTRRNLVEALRDGDRAPTREEKSRILEELIVVSGCHRKSAIRILNGTRTVNGCSHRPQRTKLYDEAVR